MKWWVMNLCASNIRSSVCRSKHPFSQMEISDCPFWTTYYFSAFNSIYHSCCSALGKSCNINLANGVQGSHVTRWGHRAILPEVSFTTSYGRFKQINKRHLKEKWRLEFVFLWLLCLRPWGVILVNKLPRGFWWLGNKCFRWVKLCVACLGSQALLRKQIS